MVLEPGSVGAPGERRAEEGAAGWEAGGGGRSGWHPGLSGWETARGGGEGSSARLSLASHTGRGRVTSRWPSLCGH